MPIKKDAPIGTRVYAGLEVVLLIVLIVNHYSLVTAVAGHREGHLGCCCRPWVWVSDSRYPVAYKNCMASLTGTMWLVDIC